VQRRSPLPPISVHELELPDFSEEWLSSGADRSASFRRLESSWEHHWLAKTSMGFAVTRHEDVYAVLRDRRFENALSKLHQDVVIVDEDGTERIASKSMVVMEGEEHTRLRRLVSPAFSPKAADRLRPFMREVANGLIDAVAQDGRVEAVSQLCDPYPVPVISELLGAPKGDWRQFSEWAEIMFRRYSKDAADQMPAIRQASQDLRTYMVSLIKSRRRDPQDDLLSILIAVEEEGDRLSTEELTTMAETILMAGTDTTRNQLGSSIAILMDHPEQWDLLAKDPELASQAVEECLRYVVAVRGTSRFASEDIEYRGVLFPAGTVVETVSMSANMDTEAWGDNAEVFDITKERTAKNVTFGSGFHHCLGAALARAQLQEMLPLLAKRLPDLALDGPLVWKPPTTGIWGPSSLPLRFTTQPTSD